MPKGADVPAALYPWACSEELYDCHLMGNPWMESYEHFLVSLYVFIENS